MKTNEAKARKFPTLHVVYLDDDPFQLEQFSKSLEGNGPGCEFELETLSSIEAFRKSLSKPSKPEVIVLDIHLAQEKSGIDLLQEIRAAHPGAVVFMRSGTDDMDTISRSLENGADDFLSKKSDKTELKMRLWNSYRLAKLKKGSDLRQQVRSVSGEAKKRPVVGKVMLQIEKRIPLLMRSAVSAIHVSGESGTGKEVVADLVESQVPSGAPFVRVNCGAIAPTLLESELFGHQKGAFTGASGDKKGLFETASGGWIFLDEVATLTPQAQTALLRVIENQEVVRVGSSNPIRIQVRVLSATNESLKELVEAKKFRKDLWQRLTETEINLPPLRERLEEIEPLVKHFCKEMPGGPYEITQPALEVLTKFSWESGNVRELRNCLRAMTELHVNKLLTPLSIPERMWKQIEETPEAQGQTTKGEKAAPSKLNAFQITLAIKDEVSFDGLTDQLLLNLVRELFRSEGKMSLRSLSKRIGVSRSTLSAKLRQLVQNGKADLQELSNMVGISGD